MRPYMHSANSAAPVGADYKSARTRCVMVAAPVVVQGAYAMRPYMHSANSTAPVGADYIVKCNMVYTWV